MELQVKDISMELGARPAKRVLEHVGFTAYDREFLSLLGASGAGKSTLLKIIAGILIQDEGTVLFGGMSVDAVPAHKRHVGFVFQDMRLFPNMNVEENIAFPCKMAKMPKHERLKRARHLLEQVQLGGFGSRDVVSLSGGQQQRVALARALAVRPKVLLLDEPFSGLDENLRDEIRSLVLDLHKSFDMTTIMVTHDALEALEMSDRIVYISEGRVVQDGRPSALYQEPASLEIAACFGECSTIEGKVAEGIFSRGSFLLTARGCPEGEAVAVIRHRGVTFAIGGREGSPTDASGIRDDAEGFPINDSVYQGNAYLVHADIEGQRLSAYVPGPLPAGRKVGITVDSDSYFIYPRQNR